MLSRVIAKNIGDVFFLRHSVVRFYNRTVSDQQNPVVDSML